MRKVCGYYRVSKDEASDGLGIERQRDAVKRFVEERGWTLDPAWQIEETVSASVKKKRPGFERILDGMRRGEVSMVVAYAQDRLARRLQDTARLLDVVEASGCGVTTVTGGFDLTTGYGRGFAGVMGSVAAMETQVMSERHKQRALQNARRGRVANGGRRPFGFRTNRRTLVPEEAALIREAYERLDGGSSLSAIVKDWNRRGIPTANGSRWTTKILRGTLSRPALCRRVMHRGALVRDDHGDPVLGQWPAILDPGEFDRLQVLLAARVRVGERWTSERRHLLTGLLRCGRCDGTMIAFRQSNGVWSYTCRDFRHLARNEANVDRHVLAEVQAHAAEVRLPIPEWTDPDGAEIADEIATLEQRKHDTIRHLVDGTLTADTFTATVAGFDARITELRERQVQEVAAPFEAVELDLSAGFEDMTLTERRTAIGMFVTDVVVHPAKKRGRGFDPSLVEVRFRAPEQMQVRAVIR